MKIIHIMDNLNTAGGVNSFVYDLCISQKELGEDVSLIAILGNENEILKQAQVVRDADIPVYCLCCKTKFQAIRYGIPKLKKLIYSITNGTEAICNIHLKLGVLMTCIAIGKNKNIHLVETYHSQYKNYWLQYNLCKHYISKYIPCSFSAENEMKKRFHIPKEKIFTIPNGVNQRKIRLVANKLSENVDEKNVTLAKNNSQIENDGVKRFISVGRFTEQKNFEVSVAAFTSLSEDYIIYDIYGNGPEEERIKEVSNNDPRVLFKGNVSREEIINALNQCDMVIMPSLWEGLSIFMLEALSLGCPLMVSDIESFRNVLKEPSLNNNETWRKCSWGYLVETCCVSAYSEAIKDYLNSIDNKDNMHRASLEIASNYDISKTATKYIALYKSLL